MSDRHEPAIRAEAIESLLIEKGLISATAIDEVVERYNDRTGPLNGARVVARAWRDPAFKAALLADGTAAVRTVRIRRRGDGKTRRRRKHDDGTQRRRLHAVFVLSMGDAGFAATLVQGSGVSFAHRPRAASRA